MLNDTLQQRLITALRDPRRYPHAVKSVQVIETHISWALLAGHFAYKIKKALDLGFLDFTDLKTRRSCCEEELRLNRRTSDTLLAKPADCGRRCDAATPAPECSAPPCRCRTAPDIYLDVVSIGGSPDAPKFGTQPAIEYAVRMRRFATSNLLDRLLVCGKLTPRHIDTLAATLARFHADIPVVDSDSPLGTCASIKAAMLQNFEQMLALLTDSADRKSIAALRLASEDEFDACKKIFKVRRAQGFVRECHGDLHLGNIVLVGDKPVLFDCIEFNPALRWIDVMDEVAFTVMDLQHRNHPQFAWRFLNAVLEANGDYAGLAVLRFYLSYRAAVRAKVCAIRAGQTDSSKRARANELEACRSYLALARRLLTPRKAALIITCGLPGSGKTTFSQFVLEQMGAIRIRSDVERKRLFGLSALQSSRSHAGDIYGAQATARTYARLYQLARELLAAGFTVIVDGAFLKQEEREKFRELAKKMSVRFAIASLHAAGTTLRKRIRQRSNDASEADVAVLEKLQAIHQHLSLDELAWSVNFTTEEAPDSKDNSINWNKLTTLLESV